MNPERLIAAAGPIRALAALGGLFVAYAATVAGGLLLDGATLIGVAVNFLIIGGPGVALLYGTDRLRRSGIDPAVYPRVALWTAGSVAALLVVVGLLILDPGGTINRPLNAAVMGAGVGGLGGFLIGTNQAKAITRAREAEQRNRELEQTQAKLERTVERLETSNERLEQFAYAASHDLQEPLRMVSSYLQLIEDRYGDELDGDGEEFIDFAVDGADRMREMIAGLLEYSRIETRSDPMEPVDLKEPLAEVRSDLQVKIEESDAELSAEPLPTVMGDRHQLRQVFQNLVSNAIEYSGEGEPRIHVDAERNGSHVTVTVSDEGIGIEPSDAKRIFDVFQSAHEDGRGGTGIGLALCERIVERHGGEIWVESEPGAGSCFYFTLHPADGDWRPQSPSTS